MLKLVLICILLNITCRSIVINGFSEHPMPNNDDNKQTPISNEKVKVYVSLSKGKANDTNESTKTDTGSKTNEKVAEVVGHNDKKTISSTTLIPIPVRTNSKNDLLQSGALLRGFYVFLGLSVLTMFYFVYRSYRLRHGSQPSTTVKKYGITARRSDMEMRPLELDDDDDDTLFEINTQTANR